MQVYHLPPRKHAVYGLSGSGHPPDLLLGLSSGIGGLVQNRRVDVVPSNRALDAQLSVGVSRLRCDQSREAQ